jgi:undecaprenyl-diphosphatase
VIQLGAILCLPIYFWRRITGFLTTFPGGTLGRRTAITHPLTLTLIAFLCTAIPSFLLRKVIGKNLESLLLMGTALVAGGIVMWLVDAIFGRRQSEAGPHTAEEEVEQMNVGQAIWIGLCQILSAVFPGTSRSMATIAAGQTAGLSRTAALEFSFLLSIPTMAAATIYDLLKSVRGGASAASDSIGTTHIDAHGWVLLAIGFIVSFVVAFAVVAWFMQWVRRHGFVPFAVYRIIAGACVLAWAFQGGL